MLKNAEYRTIYAAAVVAGIVNPETAADMTYYAREAVKADGRINYSKYVEMYNVTLDNVRDHAVLSASLAFPDVKRSSRADHGTPEYRAHAHYVKVKAGLTRVFGTGEPVKSGHLLTTDGAKRLSQMSDDDLLAAVRAELADRAGTAIAGMLDD